MTSVDEPTPAPAVAEPSPRRKRALRDGVVQLVTITAGVLIALFFDGLVSWNQNRALAREARATIAREIADNSKDLHASVTGFATSRKNLANALRFAEELLATRKTDIRKIELGLTFAELSAVSWHTAERTGALSHMEYADVQRYSRLYGWQELFTDHQRRAVERVASATAIFAGGDPQQASAADLQAFRQQVLALHGDMTILEQLAARLSELYAAELKP